MFKTFNPKYRFFKAKVGAVTKSIWELEFKIEKSRQIREGTRGDRDRAIEALTRNQAALKDEKLPKEKKEEIEKACEVLADNAKRYEGQMAMIDNEINGIPASADSAGQQGLLETVRALVELRSLYKEYLKSL